MKIFDLDGGPEIDQEAVEALCKLVVLNANKDTVEPGEPTSGFYNPKGLKLHRLLFTYDSLWRANVSLRQKINKLEDDLQHMQTLLDNLQLLQSSTSKSNPPAVQ